MGGYLGRPESLFGTHFVGFVVFRLIICILFFGHALIKLQTRSRWRGAWSFVRSYLSWTGDHYRATFRRRESNTSTGFYSVAIQALSSRIVGFYRYSEFFHHLSPQDASIYLLDLTCSLTSIMFMLKPDHCLSIYFASKKPGRGICQLKFINSSQVKVKYEFS